jgi:hypothetical protein
VNAPKCELQIGANIGKRAVERRGTCHDHIVEARICAGSGNCGKCCLDPTPHAIADYGTAKLPGDGETKAWQIARGGIRTASAPGCGDNCTLPQSGRGRIRSWSAFHQECWSRPAPTTADALEFRPLLQGGDSHCSDRPTAASMLAAFIIGFKVADRARSSSHTRPRGACGPSRDAVRARAGRPWSASGRGSRGGVCARGGLADRCVSRAHLRVPTNRGALALGLRWPSLSHVGNTMGQLISAVWVQVNGDAPMPDALSFCRQGAAAAERRGRPRPMRGSLSSRPSIAWATRRLARSFQCQS